MLVILLPYFHLRYQLLKSIIFVCVDSRDLCLSSYVQKYVKEPSRISPELNSGSATPVVSLPSLEGSLDNAAVKQEFIHHSTIKTSNSTVSNSKLVDSTVIKSEPSHEGSQERSKTADSTATVAFPIVGTATKLTNHALKYSSVVTKKEVADDHDGCRFKLMNEPSDPRDSGEGCVSDEEKITLSADMLEELFQEAKQLAKDFQTTFNKYDVVIMNSMLCAFCRVGEMDSLSADQIYTVELIGGASRVPKLQAKLQEFLGRKGIDWQLDADEAIVLGAALHAANDGIRNRTTN
ncbi:hypothetical protein RYX36_026439 [Vicia faba]